MENQIEKHSAEFPTDTRYVKRVFVGLAAFLFVSLFLCSLYGRPPLFGHSFTLTLGLAFSFIASFAFLIFIWCYGLICMFDRIYTISNDAVSVSLRGSVLRSIRWDEVARVSRGHLRVTAKDGRKISFNLPPEVRSRALHLIEQQVARNRNET